MTSLTDTDLDLLEVVLEKAATGAGFATYLRSEMSSKGKSLHFTEPSLAVTSSPLMNSHI